MSHDAKSFVHHLDGRGQAMRCTFLIDVGQEQAQRCLVLAYEAVTITRVDQLFVAALDQLFVAGITARRTTKTSRACGPEAQGCRLSPTPITQYRPRCPDFYVLLRAATPCRITRSVRLCAREGDGIYEEFVFFVRAILTIKLIEWVVRISRITTTPSIIIGEETTAFMG